MTTDPEQWLPLTHALDGLVQALEQVDDLQELAVLLSVTGDLQAERWRHLVGPEEVDLQLRFWHALGDVAIAVHHVRKED